MVRKTVQHVKYNFFESKAEEAKKELGKEGLIQVLKEMLLIRHFEMRAESAYQQGKVGGFFHAYMGQEAIQTAAVHALGRENNWWITTYRCHALAYLNGATPNEMMAELYGKATGNAMGRGGSMHFYQDRLLGGFGIVGGHLPIATGAAFSLKYQKQDGVAVCFLGDGAFVQGAVHESLNLASLWDLPCIYVVENNQWGMGTAVNRALCVQPIAEHFAPAYGMKAYTLDGMDFTNCYGGFKHIYEEVRKTGRPILVEAVTERFRGHSISDPGLYRSKKELEVAKGRDPIELFKAYLKKEKILTDKAFEEMDKEQKDIVVASMKFAEESPDPEPMTLEEDVFAP
ncbi:MAG: pyruvate dehydrogenase (acetyl-transferring) E1 component subunit alpha [Chlamydiales bacterium]|nr:pyruvate dehydrogenase (acetyl-transferring) E1 component subunit alpha [Chlamydiales bacterium]